MSDLNTTDPAIAAARRAWEKGPDEVAKIPYCAGEHGLWTPEAMEAAAREALAPLRRLHQPVNAHGSGRICCSHCWDSMGHYVTWPCSTARSIYAADELTR